MRKLPLLLFLAFCLPFTPAFSQNRAFPNAIHAKLNVNDYGLLFNNELNIGQGFEFAYFRNIAPALNVGIPLKLGLAKLPNTSGNTVVSSLDLIFRLENIKSEATITPFAFVGAGYVLESFENGHAQLPFGAGIHYKLSPYSFLTLQLEYRKALIDDRDNLQVGLGIVYLLHKSENQPVVPTVTPNDDDLDGVLNDVDKCPTEAGPAVSLGCPDRDSDGVSDPDDQCPDDAGTPLSAGCPDYDNDGLADKDDECPTEAGALMGCPDADNDGVADKNDQCPTQAGTIADNGCPPARDTDNDGFNDEEDACPDMAGPLNGCPDADGDSVADKDDKCPNEAGVTSNNGCPEVVAEPDADGDGVPDKNDPCPNKTGIFGGCPDSDGDNIADNLDKCPTVPGIASNNGCPEVKVDPDTDGDGVLDKNDPCPDKAGQIGGCPDSDGDGVADNVDKCPGVPGTTSNAGCPEVVTETDKDGDGVEDRLDKCPTVAGPKTNFGCPEVKKESKDRLDYAAQAVQFETGKAILKNESYSILDEIVAIMRENPAYTLTISGYTDDIGNEEANLTLSQNRAKACYDYLIFRGIKTERLRYAGFGENRPIADNKTAEGRELNRRVVFELLLD